LSDQGMHVQPSSTAIEDRAATAQLEKMGYQQELKRAMNVWELTAFGINYMIPIAPAIIFGFILQTSGGTVAIPYFLAGIGMLFTAGSYAVMVRNYPLAGSLYSYVSRGIQAHVGFMSGWVLMLDYVFIPTVTSASAAIYIGTFVPGVPYEVWLVLFAVVMGMLNIFGVELLAKLGIWMLFIGEAVVFAGFFVWAYAVGVHHVGVGTVLSTMPFKFTSWSAVMGATSLAVLSYTGFDAITTLAEESHNPKRDIPKAIYWAVGIGMLTMVLTGYFGMLPIPDWRQHISNVTWASTTLMQVSRITGGPGFAAFYAAGYLLAMAVFNVVATAAGARLLYGMGRDGMLPKQVFAAIGKRWKTPHWNIVIIVAIEFILGSVMNVANISSLINYGALAGFAMLNLSVIWLYYVRRKGVGPERLGEPANWRPQARDWVRLFLMPGLGFIVLAWVFSSLDRVALTVGTAWLILGLVYTAIKTRGFKEKPPQLEL